MSCLIYQYKCESCCALYIGKTEQHLKSRISQHQGKSDRTGSILQVPVQSDIRIHCLKHKQHVNSDNFTILDQINFSSDLCTLESLYQKTLKPTIGVQSQSTPLIMFPQCLSLICFPQCVFQSRGIQFLFLIQLQFYVFVLYMYFKSFIFQFQMMITEFIEISK